MNWQSVNDTQQHFAELDKLVRDMKRLRKRLGRKADESFLRELLYPSDASTSPSKAEAGIENHP